MFGSNILEVAIGMIFIFLLYSLLATSVNEAIASYLGLRAKTLKKAIERMLDDNSGKTVLSDKFYKEPLIKYLGESALFGKIQRKPAYLTAQNFSKNVLDLIKDLDDSGTNTDALAKIKAGIEKIPAEDTRKFIRSLMEDADHKPDKFRLLLEQWYNDTMERASGWYKRKVQFMIFFIGLGISIVFNVDSLEMVNKLSKDPESRKLLVEMAAAHIANSEKAAKKQEITDTTAQGTAAAGKIKSDTLEMKLDSIVTATKRLLENDINKANNLLSVGWGNYGGAKDWLGKLKYVLPQIFTVRKLLGFLVTTFAISLGAPFWFDLLNKLIKIRGNGNNPDETKPKASV